VLENFGDYVLLSSIIHVLISKLFREDFLFCCINNLFKVGVGLLSEGYWITDSCVVGQIHDSSGVGVLRRH
jgi:hypothetical protein